MQSKGMVKMRYGVNLSLLWLVKATEEFLLRYYLFSWYHMNRKFFKKVGLGMA